VETPSDDVDLKDCGLRLDSYLLQDLYELRGEGINLL
jgi:hypothetical protein